MRRLPLNHLAYCYSRCKGTFYCVEAKLKSLSWYTSIIDLWIRPHVYVRHHVRAVTLRNVKQEKSGSVHRFFVRITLRLHFFIRTHFVRTNRLKMTASPLQASLRPISTKLQYARFAQFWEKLHCYVWFSGASVFHSLTPVSHPLFLYCLLTRHFLIVHYHIVQFMNCEC